VAAAKAGFGFALEVPPEDFDFFFLGFAVCRELVELYLSKAKQ
jgi:hypothetical protein